jgi:hypothetical protein
MNKLELVVYNLVKDNPRLKQQIVDVYQGLLGLVPQRALQCSLPHVTRTGYFYGFHDKSPFSADGTSLLAHRNLIGDRTVAAGDAAEVGVFRGNDWTEFTPLGRTTGWNWQLGSMLQWCGRECRDVVFNTLDGDRPVAEQVAATGSGAPRRWPFPVVHVSADGTHASSYDFLRVEAAMPGYGAVVAAPRLDDAGRNPFRIFRSADGAVTFELSLAEAAAISHHPSMDGAFHFFHHALFNPSGTRSFFLHRWVDRNERRWTRMFSVGVDGRGLYLFPMDEMVSHITWARDDAVFAYARYPGQGDGYYLIEDLTGQATRHFAGVLNSDGHPTMDPARDVVITDTYPDRFRNQFLVLGRPGTQRRVDLARTHLPSKFRRELQVDLHPRLHPSRPVACVDTGHTGTRALMTVDFSSVLR